ncbi:MAG: RecB family exonuclease [Candidatus Acidiferrales bacterium]
MQSLPPIYSHSALSDFEQCPLKYRLKYLDGIKTGVESVEIFLGNRVHEALKKLYDGLLNGELNQLDNLIDFYTDRWNSKWHTDVRLVSPGETAEDYFRYGAECIEGYYETYYPFDDSYTIVVEEKVQFEIDLGWSGGRSFRGKVDRVASRPDGTHEIHDYKTSKLGSGWDGSKLANAWRQLTLYQHAIQSKHPEVQSVSLSLHYLRSREFFCRQLSKSEITAVLQSTKEQIVRIEGEVEFPAKAQGLCKWCEFLERCPAGREYVSNLNRSCR